LNGLPYYKAYPRDFVEGTIGMPFEVKCAYRVVIDLIYMQGGRLPDDARYISGHLGCSVRKWKSIRQTLVELGKLIVSGDFLTNYRADKEIESLSKLQEKQAENARHPRKNKNLQEPRQRHTEPEPEENPHSPQGGGDLFDPFWNLYPRKVGKEAARKAFDKASKKAPVSDIMAGLHAQLPAMLATEPRFQPHPATWLNQGRWQDEVQKPERKARNLTDAWINS
jgi:uncharacterized protein YdaU (DUF1376 family)